MESRRASIEDQDLDTYVLRIYGRGGEDRLEFEAGVGFKLLKERQFWSVVGCRVVVASRVVLRQGIGRRSAKVFWNIRAFEWQI